MKKIRFSIIIPAYNTEDYLKDCLDSVFNQTYKNFEVIVVNDGSTDNSYKIIASYKNQKNLIVLNQENQGLSVSRNNGVDVAKGEYIIFLDSDDYLELDALEIIDKNLNDEDVLRFQLTTVDENGNMLKKEFGCEFRNINGPKSFENIVKEKYIDNAWLYCYQNTFYKDNKFKFKKGFYHEDFGLVPIILLKAKKVSSINNSLYNYRQRKNSIMTTKNQDMNYKKINDFYELGITNIKKIRRYNVINKHLFLSYIANCLVVKGKALSKKERKNYYNNLRKDCVFDFMLQDTLLRKMKFLLAKYNYNLYLKVIK